MAGQSFQGYLTTGDLAREFGVSTTRIMQLEREGIFPRAERTGSRNMRIWPAAQLPDIRRAFRERGKRAGSAPVPEAFRDSGR